ncbi:MAG: four-helix bundle copper-binding protein [Deltaproteobacteria bacterium]|nr:four-helix bundle copper-binding protein [Deltaproteobacteria bacterium]
MKRRELFVAAGGFAAAAALGKLEGTAFAGDHKHDHSHGTNTGLIDAALDCVKRAEACLNHCIDVLGRGDTSLAKCAKSVTELKIYCTALYQAGIINSEYLKKIAALSEKVCTDCEKECRKHKKHQTCLNCADACVKCLKECKKLLA